MKKILIGLLLAVSVFVGNTYAGGHPTSSANLLSVLGLVDEMPAEPDFNFTIEDEDDFYEMSKILYKYYNTYNLYVFNERDTADIVMKIEKIQNMLNPLVATYLPPVWGIKNFILGKSNQEANTDLLKSLGYDVGIIGISPHGLGEVDWKNGKYSYETTFYILAKDVEHSNQEENGEFELDEIITSDLLVQYSIYDALYIDKFINFNLRGHIINNSLKGNYSTHIGLYIKEGEDYIKVPTYFNYPYIFDNTDLIGIGANFYSDSFRPYLFSLSSDGPASKAGLQIGDLVIAVNDRPVSNPQQNMIFGEKSETIKITVLRKGQLFDFDVILDDILIPDMLSIDNYDGYLSNLEKVEEISVSAIPEGYISLDHHGIYNDDYVISNYEENNNYVALINTGSNIGQNFLLNDGTVNENVIEKEILGKNFTIKVEDILTDYEGKKLDYEVKIYVKIGDQYYYGGRRGENMYSGDFDLTHQGKEYSIAIPSERSGSKYSEQLISLLKKYEEKVGTEQFKNVSSKLKSQIEDIIYTKIDGLKSEQDHIDNKTLFQKLYTLKRLLTNYTQYGEFCYICNEY